MVKKFGKVNPKSILNKTSVNGFLGDEFTHSINPYVGCSYGCTYCYAQFLAWPFRSGTDKWGDAVDIKLDAAKVLRKELVGKTMHELESIFVFMSSATDPYQPIEHKRKVTRGILEVLCEFPQVALLIQTRSSIAKRDFDLIQDRRRTVLSITIETDDFKLIRTAHSGDSPDNRFKLVEKALDLDIKTQIAVSPLLPHTPNFAQRLSDSGAGCIVVDDFVNGDGDRGNRTAKTDFGKTFPSEWWMNKAHATRLYNKLHELRDQQSAGFMITRSKFGTYLNTLPVPGRIF